MSALFATFGIDWHLLIAQAANFAILVVALTYLLYKPVRNMVKERERVVAKGVEDAELAAKKLASADTEARAKAGAADKEAIAIVAAARSEAGAEKNKILEEAQARAGAVERDAAARAASEAARVKAESEKEIARLAVLAAERVLAHKS